MKIPAKQATWTQDRDQVGRGGRRRLTQRSETKPAASEDAAVRNSKGMSFACDE